MRFVIAEDGRVTEAHVECLPEETRACVERTLLGLRFPAGVTGVGRVTVWYP
jgi:hypothetical protein